MATGRVDFSAISTGTGVPTGWTEYGLAGTWVVQTDATAIQGKSIEYTMGGASARTALAYDASDSVLSTQDLEILSRVQWSGTRSVDFAWLAGAQNISETSGSGNFRFGAPLQTGATSGQVEVASYFSGTSSFATNSSGPPVSLTTGTWFWVRTYREAGATIYYSRVWEFGTTEPGSWDHSSSLGAYGNMPAGHIGFGCPNEDSGAVFTVDYLSWGIDEAAPLEVGDTINGTVVNIPFEVVSPTYAKNVNTITGTTVDVSSDVIEPLVVSKPSLRKAITVVPGIRKLGEGSNSNRITSTMMLEKKGFLDLTNADSVTLTMKKADGTVALSGVTCVIANATLGTVYYDVEEGTLSDGEYRLQFRVNYGGNAIAVAPTQGYARLTVTDTLTD